MSDDDEVTFVVPPQSVFHNDYGYTEGDSCRNAGKHQNLCIFDTFMALECKKEREKERKKKKKERKAGRKEKKSVCQVCSLSTLRPNTFLHATLQVTVSARPSISLSRFAFFALLSI